TASAIAHLSIVALLVLMSEVHPLGSSTESIAVDIVTPQEVEGEKAKAGNKPEEPQLKLPETSVFDQKPASQQSASQQSPSKQPPSKQSSPASASSPAAAPAPAPQAASSRSPPSAPSQAPKP